MYSDRSGRPSARVNARPAHGQSAPSCDRLRCASWRRRSTDTVQRHDAPARLALRRPEQQSAILAGQLLGEGQPGGVQVNVGPGQPGGLAAAQRPGPVTRHPACGNTSKIKLARKLGLGRSVLAHIDFGARACRLGAAERRAIHVVALRRTSGSSIAVVHVNWPPCLRVRCPRSRRGASVARCHRVLLRLGHHPLVVLPRRRWPR